MLAFNYLNQLHIYINNSPVSRWQKSTDFYPPTTVLLTN